MPVRAPRVCGHCDLTHISGEECAIVAERNRARKAAFDKKRPSSRQRGYTAEWERESRAFLKANPVCRRCGAPSTLIDHIQPHKGNQRLFWNKANWQPLCTPCHNGWKQSTERKAQ